MASTSSVQGIMCYQGSDPSLQNLKNVFSPLNSFQPLFRLLTADRKICMFGERKEFKIMKHFDYLITLF